MLKDLLKKFSMKELYKNNYSDKDLTKGKEAVIKTLIKNKGKKENLSKKK